jgi:hypothetical protein
MSRRSTILAAIAALATLAAGCVAAGSPAPSGSTGGSASPEGFRLLAWTTQAVAPEAAFRTMARLAIADGVLVDTAVAVPAIYPGQLLVEPIARSISAAGISAIEAELRAQGLLVDSDFTAAGEPLLGAVTAHLEVVVDGQTYTLSGDPDAVLRCGATQRCIADPGTAGAFSAFWQKLTGDLDGWLGTDLGSSGTYDIERLSILLAHPIETFAPLPSGAASQKRWPLGSFDTFGVPYAGSRCGTVSGSDLATLLPLLRQSNQLTTFVDTNGTVRSLVLHPLIPGEPDPCTGSPEATATPAPILSPSAGAGGASPSAGTSGGSEPGSGPTSPTASEGTSGDGSSSGSGGTISSGLGVPTVDGLACDAAGPVFSASALSGPAGADQSTDAAASALRNLLASGSMDAAFLPRTGWRRVASEPDQVLFVAPVPGSDPPYASVTVAPKSGSSEWSVTAWGQCRIQAHLASPFAVATWTLEATPQSSATTITALVSESTCAGGELAAGRISDPLVAYGDTTVTITFGVVPLGGAQTCPLPPPSPVTVQLREPLGDRQLQDGSVYPPAPVTISNPH